MQLGDKFGDRTVIGDADRTKAGPRVRVECKCGAVDVVSQWHLINGHSQSCRSCASSIKVPTVAALELAEIRSTEHTDDHSWDRGSMR